MDKLQPESLREPQPEPIKKVTGAGAKGIRPKRLSTPRVRQTHLISQTFQGPLPPPELLRQYEQITPGLAGRITAMAEGNATHRQGMENKIANANIFAMFSGQVFGFLIIVLGMIAGVYLIVHGEQVTGFLSMLVPLGAIGWRFAFGRKENTEDNVPATPSEDGGTIPSDAARI